jgi:hypothetical protein
LQLVAGEIEAAIGTRQRAVTAADRTGGHLNQAQSRLGLAEALIEAGAFADAESVLADAHDRGVRLGGRRVTAVALRLMGQIALETGRLIEAAGLLEDAITDLAALTAHRQQMLARGDLAIVHLLRDLPDDAAVLLADLDGLETADPWLGWLKGLAGVARRQPIGSLADGWRAGAMSVLRAIALPSDWPARRAVLCAALSDQDEPGRCMRIARRLAGRLMAREDAHGDAPCLQVALDGAWCRLPPADRLDFGRRHKLRGLLQLFVEAREARPGEWVTAEAIRQAVWPDALMQTVRRRLHTTVYNLRKLALGDWLESSGDRYRVRLDLRIQRPESP